ncbi:non-ribosomal peptide synthetase/type I polyketide synthase [Micromonospora craniellae]|uniref:Phenyloxazoline synthase MbtB n=1 Tax=Micromonospora craniellae TaxID=2294034 RepID=A0A372FXU0_9ACTN|nr:non-ribosomal peptide synthetase/type I polyketide synthase [Micromonospora craniellae]RFS45612.1 amino acid adenylation domain-containing protein [Micromonospora craniellae]
MSPVDDTDLAIIGMSGRFPGAPDVDTFWRNLRAGHESIVPVTEADLDAAGVPEQIRRLPGYVPAGAFLDGIDQFDAGFFGFTPREAALLDPQQRLFLECAWEALEHAGADPGTAGSVGLYAGANLPAYLLANLLGGGLLLPDASGFELLIHNDKDYLATRVGYKLGLTGPCVTVQTACSTSLVAVHLAGQALIDGECDLALAGGVCVRVPHRVGYLAEEGLIFSPDGHCRPFDADANGTVFGSGAGVVVLKRLGDALRDGDRVEAVIKASATNNDGGQKVGYTAPSIDGQTAVIAAALAAGGIDAGTITAIEAHGTGTAIGDPIEVTALTRAFREYTAEKGFCALGSVKSNIGHLDTAAGVAGLIKAVLQLKHGELVPSLHFRRPNPEIDFDRTPFYVSAEHASWKANGTPRRIGVSSFGIGGTNAHVIVEQPPIPAAPVPEPRREQIVVLSAATPAALDEAADRLARAVAAPTPSLADLAYTLQAGRRHHRFRRALVCADRDELPRLLTGTEPDRVATYDSRADEAGAVLLFPGQGTQYPGMAADLYRDEPRFRAVVDECCESLRPHLGYDLRDLLLNRDEGLADRLTETANAQPALFVTEYALVRLLEGWGVRPTAMLGHSVGELVAATVAGVFTLPDALRAVAVRGRLMSARPSGAMLSVAASEDRVRALLPSGLDIAAINADELVVVAGPVEAVAEFTTLLAAEDIPARALHTSHAFHSSAMDPVVEALAAELAATPLGPPRIRFVSDVTGTWITDDDAVDPWYWARQVRATVRFSDGVRTVTADGPVTLVEVGPGQVLGMMARQSLPASPRCVTVATLPSATEDRSGTLSVQVALGRLWTTGVQIDFRALHSGPRTPAVLPGYPFQRRRHWIERPGAAAVAALPAIAEAPDDSGESTRPFLLTEYVAPQDDRGRLVAGIWSEFFGVAPIGLHDSFFELGGHSLLAARIVARLAGSGVRITLQQLLAAPTIAGVLAAADGGDQDDDAWPTAIADPGARHEPFPLLEMQQAQWLGRIGSFDMGDVAAHVYLEYESTTLDLDRLQTAWQRVVDRHDMLRAVVLPDGRQQVLQDVPPYRIKIVDVNDDEVAGALRDRMSTQVLPAGEWPLWEVAASRFPDGRIRVHISFDLLTADVASLFFQVDRDWRRFYEEPELVLEPLAAGFRDYVLAETALRETSRYVRSLEWWRERVRTLPPAPELPAGPGVDGPAAFTRRHARLTPQRWSEVKRLAARHGVTSSSVVLAAYAAVLGRWSKAQHFTLNLTAVNRLPLHPDVEKMVGEFASFNLLEVDLRGLTTFADLVRQVQDRSWQDLEHRVVSGVRVLRELARVRGSGTGALMPVVFTSALMQEAEGTGGPFAWLGESRFTISQTPQVSLDHFAMEVDGALDLSWHYVEELFAPGVVDDMFEAYTALVEVLAEPQAWSGWPVRLPVYQAAVMAAVNATAGPVPGGLLGGEVFARAAERPDAPAVFSHGRWHSYAEITGRALALAAVTGVTPGEVVAVGAAKGWRQVVAVLAVTAAGGVYVPIDPGLPPERRRGLIGHSGATCVLTDPGGDDDWGVPVHVVAEQGPVTRADLTYTPRAVPADVAYIIYTSGSTGTPKGVAVSHRAALNTLHDVSTRYGVTAGDRVLGISSLSFDLSVYDVFGILGAGAGLVLPDSEHLRDPQHWTALIVEQRVTVWNSVPALAQMLTEHAAATDGRLPLRIVLLSGDWIPTSLPDRIRAIAPLSEVISLGGATEAAVWSIAHPIDRVEPGWTSVPYGKPLTNQTFAVTNQRGEPCPIWVPGELVIGGAGVAEGYWNDPERTAHSFPRTPTGQREYRTGDLGRYRPDGSIEFLGREDFQVKIGGYRIELGEIEHVLCDHPAVRESVVIATGERGHQRLAAYVTAAGDAEPDALRAHLVDRLPAYMVPLHIAVLPALPLSGNGKVDRAALPAPEAGAAPATTPDEPTDIRAQAIIDQLTGLFADVLRIEEVGPHDNFFEIGGDSILGIQIVTRASAEGLTVTPQQLFDHPTIAELAAAMVDTRNSGSEGAALTRYQAMLLDAGEPASWLLLDVADAFDPAVAERALDDLTTRHSALRLSADPHSGEQHVSATPAASAYVPELDLEALPAEDRPRLLAQMTAEMADELDPRTGDVLKMALFQTGGVRRLALLVHPVAADHRSVRILLHEFAEAYAGAADGIPARWATTAGCPVVWAGQTHTAPITVASGAPSRDGELITRLAAAPIDAFHTNLTETVAVALMLALRDDGQEPVRIVLARSVPTATTTVGQLTTLVVVPGIADDDLDRLIRAVKDGCRGEGHEPVTLQDGDVLLHEIAEQDWALPPGMPITLPDGFAGPNPAGSAPTGPAVALSGAVTGGELLLRLGYAPSVDATGLVGRLRDALDKLTAHAAGASVHQPSDFPLADLDDEGLAVFLNRFAASDDSEGERS